MEQRALQSAIRNCTLRCWKRQNLEYSTLYLASWGSCGLLLQQVELQQAPRDIDVYADLAAARGLHHAAPGIALDEPVIDRTGPYASLLSHYQVGECALELVGGFEVWSRQSWYRIEIEQLLIHHAPQAQIGSYTLRLMPLAHELLLIC